MGSRGREQSAPIGESGLAAGKGRPLLGDPRDALCRPGPSLEGTYPSSKVDAGVLPKASPGLGLLHVCPSFPRLHWAGQGIRLPSARLQHKAGPGEGKGPPGPLAWKPPARAGVPSTDTRPSAGSTTPAQKLGSCCSLVFWGQLPGPCRCQLGRPRSDSQGKHEGPASACRPRPAPRAARAPASRRTRPLRRAPPCRRPRSAGLRAGRCGRGPCILPGHRRGSRPSRCPG